MNQSNNTLCVSHLSYKTTLIASDDISISYIQYKDTMSNYHMQSKLHSLFHSIFAVLFMLVIKWK